MDGFTFLAANALTLVQMALGFILVGICATIVKSGKRP